MELKLNSGDTITIPDGCKAVIKDKIITFEKEVKEFEDGDFVYSINDVCKSVMIYKSKRKGCGLNFYASVMKYDSIGKCTSYNDWCAGWDRRLATEEEKKFLLDSIHAEGKDWDADKKQIVDYKCKPKVGEMFYCISYSFEAVEDRWSDDRWDNLAYNNGNCFKTEDEAQKYADKFIEILKERKL